jgi:DNA-binding LytR/AlgR family response regulator
MKTVIVEDELPARKKLRQYLQEYPKSIKVTAELSSIAETNHWFMVNATPDLVFLDIQLSDGTPFELLKEKHIRCPIIFTTAYDEYIIESLNYHSIDYLLKPIKKEKLFRALQKYEEMVLYFESRLIPFLNFLHADTKYKERMIAKKGNHSVAIGVNEIAYFFTEHKVVFLVDRSGKKYVLDDPLSELAEKLSPEYFFRLNRKYIAHIDAIVSFRSYSKGRIEVSLMNHPSQEVLISQENAQRFRNWIDR